MQTVKAHHESANVPEGTEVELQVVAGDPWAEMTPNERAELTEELEAGYRDIQSGNVVDAREALAQLQANNA